MTDIGIFIFGCCVFGIAITATMALVIGPSHPETTPEEKRKLAAAGREMQDQIRRHNEQLAS